MLDHRVLSDLSDVLTWNDFYCDQHRTLYHRMVTMNASGIPASDVLLLSKELKNNSEWDAIGGAPFLAAIATAVPVAAHAVFYAKIVADKSFRRRLIRAMNTLAGRAYDDINSVETLKRMAHGLLEKVTASKTH